MFPVTFMCKEDEKYTDEIKLCDGVADCSSSEDKNLQNCALCSTLQFVSVKIP